jgi:hypothetical protein
MTWIAMEYKHNAIHPLGYSKESRANMDALIAGIQPLSLADLEQ